MSIPRVSVAVPVYNGAALLEESLACIAGQTMRDFEVILSDNGSTDATPEICARYAAKDSRFRHLRQETTVGMMENFVVARDQASAPYFLWRAYDDLSASNYFGVLADLLDAHPNAILAVSDVKRVASQGTRARTYSFPIKSLKAKKIQRLHEHMFNNSAYWFYGMWRWEECCKITDNVFTRYPELWSGDYLVLFACALQDGIIGTDQTIFYQRRIKELRNYMHRPRSKFADISSRNSRFETVCKALIETSDLSESEKQRVQKWLPTFVHHRCYSRITLWKAWLRERLSS